MISLITRRAICATTTTTWLPADEGTTLQPKRARGVDLQHSAAGDQQRLSA
jgi:hypothetical protein